MVGDAESGTGKRRPHYYARVTELEEALEESRARLSNSAAESSRLQQLLQQEAAERRNRDKEIDELRFHLEPVSTQQDERITTAEVDVAAKEAAEAASDAAAQARVAAGVLRGALDAIAANGPPGSMEAAQRAALGQLHRQQLDAALERRDEQLAEAAVQVERAAGFLECLIEGMAEEAGRHATVIAEQEERGAVALRYTAVLAVIQRPRAVEQLGDIGSNEDATQQSPGSITLFATSQEGNVAEAAASDGVREHVTVSPRPGHARGLSLCLRAVGENDADGPTAG